MIINSYMVAAPSSSGGTGQAHSYWRLLLTANNGAGVLRFATIQFASGGSDVASGAVVLSSQPSFTDPLDSTEHFDYEAFDGNDNTWWATDENGTSLAYLGVQLGSPALIDTIFFYSRSDESSATDDDTSAAWTIQSSTDGATWLDEFSGMTGWSATNTYFQVISR